MEPNTAWLGEISELDSAGEEEVEESVEELGLIWEGGLEVSEGARLEEVGLRDSGGTLEEVGLRDSGVSQGRNKEEGIRNWRGGLTGVSGVSWSSASSELSRSGVLSDILTFLRDFSVMIKSSQCKQGHTVTGHPCLLSHFIHGEKESCYLAAFLPRRLNLTSILSTSPSSQYN